MHEPPRRLALAAVAALVLIFNPASDSAADEHGLDRPAGNPGDLKLETKTIGLDDGGVVEVQAGTYLVPENRHKPDSPPISIPFYRLSASTEKPGSPVFLLAGGPGSSWLDRFVEAENQAEVQLYRQVGDVVLFDQRGGGHSRPELSCDQRQRLPLDQALDTDELAHQLRAMARQCRDQWRAAGVDLAGYTTEQNAADVMALASALGYGKISLVGGSYGSHLALTLMRNHPQAIDRVLLYGVEGPDHTWDDPGGRLAAYQRIAGHAETSETLGPSIPEGGLLEALAAVIERLEKKPARVQVASGEQQAEVLVDAQTLRMLAGFQAGRRSRPNVWPELILDLHAGDYSFVARGAMAVRHLRLDNPMHYMMDCASGISPQREKRYTSDPARGLLGQINFEYQALCEVWQAPDLGEQFRAPLVSAIPTLIVHGTWDTSTPIENAREVLTGLAEGHLIEVIGGTHGALYNLYEHWKPMRQRTVAFLRGEPVRFPSSVTLPPVSLTPRGQ